MYRYTIVIYRIDVQQRHSLAGVAGPARCGAGDCDRWAGAQRTHHTTAHGSHLPCRHSRYRLMRPVFQTPELIILPTGVCNSVVDPKSKHIEFGSGF